MELSGTTPKSPRKAFRDRINQPLYEPGCDRDIEFELDPEWDETSRS